MTIVDKLILKKTKFWGALLILTMISSFCLIFGLKTGLPSDDRLFYELGGIENVIKKEKKLDAFMKTGKYVRSEFIAKSNKPEMVEMSPYFDLLRTYHPDEQYILKILANMVKNKDFQPASFIYGPFFFYQAGSGIFAAKLLGFLPAQSDAVYFMKNPGAFAPVYLSSRATIAAMAILAVIVVFFTGLELGGLRSGFIAALMMSSLPLYNLVGKFIKPDIPCLLWSACTLLFSIYAYKHGRLRDYLLAGVFAALAAGSKYPGILSCFYLAFYFLARNCDFSKKIKDNFKALATGKEFKYLCASALLCIATFIITNPSCILRAGTFSIDFLWISGVLRSGNFFVNLFDFLICFLYDGFFYNFGPTILILLVTGMVFAAVKPNKLYRPMFPVIILFVIMASRGRAGSDAYLLPIFVPGCLMAAYCLEKIKNRTAVWLIVMIAVIPSLALTFAYDSVAAGENARLTATKWINKNVPKGASISRLQYPVSYRTAMTNPDVYPQYSLDMQPEKAKKADYYIDSSYEWPGPSWDKRFKKNYHPSIPPSDEFVEVKRIESVPMVFGFIPLTRRYRITPYIETISPIIIIYRRKAQ